MIKPIIHPISTVLVAELSQLIESARKQAAVSVNAELTLMYWRVGARIPATALIIEAAAGSFERWNLRVGDEVEVRHVER